MSDQAKAAAKEIAELLDATDSEIEDVSDIISKHFATPAQPAPEAFDVEWARRYPDTEAREWAPVKAAARVMWDAAWQAAQGERAGLTAACPICGGDCAGANPPPLNCPNYSAKITRLAGAKP